MVINVEDELKKNTEFSRTDLEAFRDWASKQPHFPEVCDRELIIMLHSCHWSLEKAKHTLDVYFTHRTHVPEFFADRDPLSKVLTSISETLLYAMIYTPDEMVMYMRLKDFDPSKLVFADHLKYVFNVLDCMLMENGTSKGFTIVFDMKGALVGHVSRLGLLTMKKFLVYLQEALPVRLKGLHFVNTVSFMDLILALMKPFMKPELNEMLYLHPDGEALMQKVDKTLLPNDVGGTAGNAIDIDAQTRKTIIANRQFFLDEEKKKINETLRPGQPKNAGDLFGVEGSFKKLDID